VANQACSSGAVKINGKQAKAGSKVAIGDILEIQLGERVRKYEVLEIMDTVTKAQSAEMYKEIS
jgi:ribosomal 50S subunit-recycling heat shock protein